MAPTYHLWKKQYAQGPMSVWSTPETTTATTASALDRPISVETASPNPAPMTQTNFILVQTVLEANLSRRRSARLMGVQWRRADNLAVDLPTPASAWIAEISVVRHSPTNATWTPNTSTSAAKEACYLPRPRAVN